MILLYKREEEDLPSLGSKSNGGHQTRHKHGNHPNPSGDDDAAFLPKAHDADDQRSPESTTGYDDDAAIWIPPEAADDGTGHGHGHDDGGMRWEERQRAMLKAMNGQLKMLVARFLESSGLRSSAAGAGGETESWCWLDIVTSLSWEAALLIKPDDGAGEMDPASYIKVKCIASGTPRQCEVIKGLVFKKNAAHKHMPTKCHNPRLLLLRGVLGDSADTGFASFSSIQQERCHLEKAVSEMLEVCRPDVVMVERSVSRGVQELLLREGVTLVLDMKLHRLERIARCSGSPILSFEELQSKSSNKLKHCDYYHIDKVMEVGATATATGKRPSKTLMFLEGFRRPLGCTILLRGANTEELKKLKQVMHYTVFAAYQLVLETSFLEDQRVILNNRNEQMSVSTRAGQSAIPPVAVAPKHKLYRVTCDGSAEESSDFDDPNQPLVSESQAPGSPRRFIDICCHQNVYLPATSSQGATDCLKERRAGDGFHNKVDPPQNHNQQMKTWSDPWVSEERIALEENDKTSDTDEVDDVLESQSILILLSSQCLTKQVICDKSHLFRIKYYGNFDVSLGRYLQDILQNQNLSCSSCGEPPEAHMYSYTHHNGNLTVLVKRLLPEYRLPGESEGKIWMWTRCQRCEHASKSSRRVLMSTEARYLSFGKFLELSFSSHSAARRLSICGHLVNRDCLRFFGLGPKVAMFQYSSVEIYTACKPQPTLEFHSPKTHEWYEREGRNVLARGVMLFSQVEGLLGNLKDEFPDCGAFLPIKESSQLEEMLVKDKSEFMDSLVARTEAPSSVHGILDVNWLYQDLLLELYVWDRRLHQIVDRKSAEVDEKWVWNPLCESRLAYRQELEVGCLERFQLVNCYRPSHLSPLHLHRQCAEEEEVVGPPQFIVGPGGNVLSISEDEISSIISRALAIFTETESEPADRDGAKTMESCSSIGSSGSAEASIISISSDDLSSLDSSLLPSSLHPQVSVNVDGKGKYSQVICVHSKQFYNLRKKCCPSELAYIASLSRCKKWDAQGGKSKAFFAKTMDDRFVIKQINKTEFESFLKFAPDYFRHVSHSLDTRSQTCLAKILGIYQVRQVRHGKEIKMDLMVMENILFGHTVSRTYDLKGAVFSRHVVPDSDGQDTVYLDQNFVDDMRVSPIYIGGRTKHLLQRAIWNDTSFLTSINVMDYSLLVGVDKQRRELVLGIIDYLRQYTWDKQLETWVKASLVVPKNESPTVISPRDYKKRFRKFMSKHFLTVPDDWGRRATETRSASCDHQILQSWRQCFLTQDKPQQPIMACA